MMLTANDWILYLGITAIALFLLILFENLFLFMTIKDEVMHAFKLHFKRKKGFGEVLLVGKDAQYSKEIEKISEKEFRKEEGDLSSRFFVEPNLVVTNRWNRIPLLIYNKDNPYPHNLLGKERFATVETKGICPECKAAIILTDEITIPKSQEYKGEKADELDKLILGHKLTDMIADFFRKYWVWLIGIGVVTGLIVIYDAYATNQAIKTLEGRVGTLSEFIKQYVQQGAA